MKKSMLLFYLALYLTNAHASGKLPSYEIPEGMTEHEFAVSYIKGQTKGRSTGKDWEDISKEERLLILCEDVKFNSLGNDVLLPAYCEVLSANMDSPETVQRIISVFSSLDGHNLASYGNQEALRLTRETVSKSEGVSYQALIYLTIKGDGDDIELIEKAQVSDPILKGWKEEMTDALRKRVERNFVRGGQPRSLQGELSIIPSVANTGPQGVYAYHILLNAGNMAEYLRHSETGFPYLEFPDELLKMVITFDEDGNPVSSVDLAKFGLSMPVITPKPTAHDNISFGEARGLAVTFPHEAKVSAPQVETDEAKPDTAGVTGQPVKEEETPPPTEQPEDPPSGRTILWFALALLALLAGSVAAWRKAKRK